MSDRCPQCDDDAWFQRVGIEKYRHEIHEEVYQEASREAKKKADADMARKCSLGWTKLWLVHFEEIYKSMVETKRRERISKHQTELYKKDYKEKNANVCSYHGEFRW